MISVCVSCCRRQAPSVTRPTTTTIGAETLYFGALAIMFNSTSRVLEFPMKYQLVVRSCARFILYCGRLDGIAELAGTCSVADHDVLQYDFSRLTSLIKY